VLTVADDRHRLVAALRAARERAYPDGEYIEQESFMRATEIRALADRAGIAPGVSVLDLCCGVAGPGRFITGETGCAYLGVDRSASAIEIAESGARGLACRFRVADVPPVPSGPFGVVLLLETMLAFEHKGPLVEDIARALEPGGRFAFTLEAGAPLNGEERDAMPNADTVWPTPLAGVREMLSEAGLVVVWEADHTEQHCEIAESLHDAFAAEAARIAAGIGNTALDNLLAAHRLWSAWMRAGRIRKLAVVAERVA
jgi:SAM-dependent methyltransferase